MSEKKWITKLEVAPFRAVEISIIGQLERLVVPLVVSVQCGPWTPILWSSLHLLNSELFITQEGEFSFSLVCMWAKKSVSFHSLLNCMILKNDLRLDNWSSLRLTFELSASRHDGEQLIKFYRNITADIISESSISLLSILRSSFYFDGFEKLTERSRQISLFLPVSYNSSV